MPLEPEALLNASLITPALRIVVQRGGTVILDDTLVPTDVIASVAGLVVSSPGSARSFWLVVKRAHGPVGAGQPSTWA